MENKKFQLEESEEIRPKNDVILMMYGLEKSDFDFPGGTTDRQKNNLIWESFAQASQYTAANIKHMYGEPYLEKEENPLMRTLELLKSYEIVKDIVEYNIPLKKTDKMYADRLALNNSKLEIFAQSKTYMEELKKQPEAEQVRVRQNIQELQEKRAKIKEQQDQDLNNDIENGISLVGFAIPSDLKCGKSPLISQSLIDNLPKQDNEELELVNINNLNFGTLFAPKHQKGCIYLWIDRNRPYDYLYLLAEEIITHKLTLIPIRRSMSTTGQGNARLSMFLFVGMLNAYHSEKLSIQDQIWLKLVWSWGSVKNQFVEKQLTEIQKRRNFIEETPDLLPYDGSNFGRATLRRKEQTLEFSKGQKWELDGKSFTFEENAAAKIFFWYINPATGEPITLEDLQKYDPDNFDPTLHAFAVECVLPVCFQHCEKEKVTMRQLVHDVYMRDVQKYITDKKTGEKVKSPQWKDVEQSLNLLKVMNLSMTEDGQIQKFFETFTENPLYRRLINPRGSLITFDIGDDPVTKEETIIFGRQGVASFRVATLLSQCYSLESKFTDLKQLSEKSEKINSTRENMTIVRLFAHQVDMIRSSKKTTETDSRIVDTILEEAIYDFKNLSEKQKSRYRNFVLDIAERYKQNKLIKDWKPKGRGTSLKIFIYPNPDSKRIQYADSTINKIAENHRKAAKNRKKLKHDSPNN